MKIDYENIPVKVEKQFKGGEGETVMRAFADDMGRMMKLCLKPGCSIGFHTHEGDCEIVYIISGRARCFYDDTVEALSAGDVHYCPEGHGHSMTNPYEEDLIFFGVVPKK